MNHKFIEQSHRATFVFALFFAVSSVSASTALENGIRAYNSGDYMQCCDILAPLVISTEKENATAHYLYANALLRCARPKDALLEYKKALDSKPSQQVRKFCNDGIASCNKADSGYGKFRSDEVGLIQGHGYVGLVLNNQLISEVMPGSPAHVAGLHPNDNIVAVNGESAKAMNTEQLAALITGPVGSHLTMEIQRGDKHLKFDLVRAVAVASFYARADRLAKENNRANEIVRASAERVYGHADDEKSETAKPAPIPKALKPDAEDVALIKIHRRTADTTEIYNQVVFALRSVPKRIKADLHGAGCSILICPSVNEVMPESSQDKPRGYTDGGGQDNVFGQYWHATKIMYIAERASVRNSAPLLNPFVCSTLLHEMGHAFDYNKRISASPEFLAAYKSDTGSLTNSQRAQVPYFLQEGTAGPQETFAELFMETLGPKDYIRNDLHDVSKIFKLSGAEVQRRTNLASN